MSAPTVSVLLLTYGQATLVEAAIAALLAQEGEPFELVISDDASPDGTFEVIQRAVAGYRGPHTVITRCNDTNLGVGAHLNAAMAASRGELVVVAAGDDLCEPTRVRELLAAWEATGRQADLITSFVSDMDDGGQLHGVKTVDDLSQWKTAADWRARRPHVIGAAHAWTRRVFDRFGPLLPETAQEDQVITFRALASGGGVRVAKPLVRYRRGGMSAATGPQAAQDKLRRMAVQNRRHLAEVHQLLADARLTDWRAEVEPVLAAEGRRQEYLRDLLAADGFLALVRRLFSGPPVPFSWRWRKFVAVARGRAAS